MIAKAFELLIWNACLLAAGVGVTGAVGWWRLWPALVRSLGLSYLVGVAVYGVVSQLLYVCGASLALWQVLAICLLAACGAARGLRGPHSPVASAPSPAFARVAAVALLAMVALIAVDLWFQPLWAYDSWTFWTPKAHALWLLGLDPHWFTQADLTSKDYPLLLPSVEAAGFRFTGYETALLDVQSLLLFVAFLRAVYELSVEHARPVVLWAVLAMLTVAPSVTNQLAAAEADIPVAVLFAAAGACGALWLRDGRFAALAVSAVLAAGAAATKVEGTEFSVGLFLVLALLAARRSRRLLVQAVLTGASAISLAIVPWRVWLSLHDVHVQGSFGRAADLGFLLEHVTRVPLVVVYLLAKTLDPRAWLLVLPLFAVVLFSGRRTRSRSLSLYVVATATVAFLGLVLAYWSTRLGLHYQLATSTRRVVTGVVFFCAAVTPMLSEQT